MDVAIYRLCIFAFYNKNAKPDFAFYQTLFCKMQSVFLQNAIDSFVKCKSCGVYHVGGSEPRTHQSSKWVITLILQNHFKKPIGIRCVSYNTCRVGFESCNICITFSLINNRQSLCKNVVACYKHLLCMLQTLVLHFTINCVAFYKLELCILHFTTKNTNPCYVNNSISHDKVTCTCTRVVSTYTRSSYICVNLIIIVSNF